MKLFNWRITVHGDYYSAHGTVDSHPKLGRNNKITTSMIVNAYLEGNTLHIKTKNSEYELEMKYMNPEGTNIDTKLNDVILNSIIDLENGLYNKSSDELVERLRKDIEEGTKELEEKALESSNKLLEEMKNLENSVLLNYENDSYNNKLYYNIDGVIGTCKVFPHIGMFSDSLLYSAKLNNDEGIDFRYFPNAFGGTSYSISDNIQKVYVRNTSNSQIIFNDVVISNNSTEIVFDRHKEGEDE